MFVSTVYTVHVSDLRFGCFELETSGWIPKGAAVFKTKSLCEHVVKVFYFGTMLERYAVFHEAVYDTIKEIPFGEVATYKYVGEIAENLSGVKLPYPEIEVAYVVNAHEFELPFHRVIYTYIMFRNEQQKDLLIEENAIDCNMRQVRYWKSPLESKDTLDRVHRIIADKKMRFKGLQDYFYFSHENHPLAFTVNNRERKKPLLKTRCLCRKCTSQRTSTELS